MAAHDEQCYLHACLLVKCPSTESKENDLLDGRHIPGLERIEDAQGSREHKDAHSPLCSMARIDCIGKCSKPDRKRAREGLCEEESKASRGSLEGSEMAVEETKRSRCEESRGNDLSYPVVFKSVVENAEDGVS